MEKEALQLISQKYKGSEEATMNNINGLVNLEDIETES